MLRNIRNNYLETQEVDKMNAIILKNKNQLLDDLKICIDYEPDKENDLLCMMEIYLNSSQKRKELYSEI